MNRGYQKLTSRNSEMTKEVRFHFLSVENFLFFILLTSYSQSRKMDSSLAFRPYGGRANSTR